MAQPASQRRHDPSWLCDEQGPAHPCCTTHQREHPGQPCLACAESKRRRGTSYLPPAKRRLAASAPVDKPLTRPPIRPSDQPRRAHHRIPNPLATTLFEMTGGER